VHNTLAGCVSVTGTEAYSGGDLQPLHHTSSSLCDAFLVNLRCFVAGYLLDSSRRRTPRRHLPSFPGEHWRPAGRRRRRRPAGGRRSFEPLQPGLWAGSPPPSCRRGSRRCLCSLGNRPRRSRRLTFSRRGTGGSGCNGLFAARPRPRRTAGSFSTSPPDTPAEERRRIVRATPVGGEVPTGNLEKEDCKSFICVLLRTKQTTRLRLIPAH